MFYGYTSIRRFIAYLLILSGHTILAQNVTIKGRAHTSYAGKMIRVQTTTDYITNSTQDECQDTIGKDGYFELQFHADFIQPVQLKIENAAGELYVTPDYVYGVTFPEVDRSMTPNADVDYRVNIGVIGADSTELNALVFDYQQVYSSLFLTEEDRYIGRAAMFRRADTLQKVCARRYAKVQNEYFRNYVEYAIASLNASLSRGEKYLIRRYIANKPVRYQHNEYMQFFNACFKGYLNVIASQRKGQSLYNIINTRADFNQLMNFISTDPLLKTDTLRELVVIRNLWDFYFSIDFAPEAIENIISQLNQRTRISEHKKITAAMLARFNKMQVGSAAPSFFALDRDGKVVSSDQFKSRWIYLNFFSTKNPESLKEMPKINELKKKFAGRMIFVSVCIDDSVSDYKSYLRANPRFDWPVWFYRAPGHSVTAKTAYGVTGTEAYFLVNNFGYLAQSPAIAPSRGIEYRLNAIFKIRQRTTKTGIR